MMDSPMLSGSCRCCASEGAYKDVKSSYHWMGEEEIYADMLKDCFDISLSSASDGQEEGGICEICITQLRNAANFKKQVLHTEEQFKNKLQTGFFKHEIVKVEVSGEDGNDSDDNNASAEEGYSGPEFEVPIKAESPEEPKPKKRAAKKGPTTRAKKAKTDAEDPETSTKRVRQAESVIKIKTEESRRPENIKKEHRKAGKLKVIKLNKSRVGWVKKRASKSEDDSKRRKKTISIPAEKRKRATKWGAADKHHSNIKEIMECSNATPIRCYGGIGYACCFCDAQYPEPADLKKHTSTTHNDVTAANFFKTRRVDQYIIRLDITSLICKLCNGNIDTLELLLEHLRDVHSKNIYTDIKNQIVPFKFNGDALRCCICLNNFNKFKTLLWHMNSHYRNFVCEVCDAGFVNHCNLADHARTHRTGTFVCDYCPQLFDTHVKKKSHEHRIHVRSNLSHKCGYCSEMFRDYRVKEAHMIEVHNVRPLIHKCQACEKTFKNRSVLYIHIKRHHLLERPHKCEHCDMDFFSNKELKDHLVKHTGLREFQCDVCLKCFGRKNTLKTHMRTHVNDRRY